MKDVSRWMTELKEDDEFYKFQSTLIELKKIVDDQSDIGYLSGTCRKRDDPWFSRSPDSIEVFYLINHFIRRIHLIL